jgi:hypothetical protein
VGNHHDASASDAWVYSLLCYTPLRFGLAPRFCSPISLHGSVDSTLAILVILFSNLLEKRPPKLSLFCSTLSALVQAFLAIHRWTD